MVGSIFCPDCAGSGQVLFVDKGYYLLLYCKLCMANFIGSRHLTMKDLEERKQFLFSAEKTSAYWVWLRKMAPAIIDQYKKDQRKIFFDLVEQFRKEYENSKPKKSVKRTRKSK